MHPPGCVPAVLMYELLDEVVDYGLPQVGARCVDGLSFCLAFSTALTGVGLGAGGPPELRLVSTGCCRCIRLVYHADRGGGGGYPAGLWTSGAAACGHRAAAGGAAGCRQELGGGYPVLRRGFRGGEVGVLVACGACRGSGWRTAGSSELVPNRVAMGGCGENVPRLRGSGMCGWQV